ncbi:hypothetical protein [Oceanospirillum sanctuarii]|uniref:hypothetical protein n=1 Tax=Oceanospirillum sanctuarii TaxID=1434821 RepID=UPI000A37865D|nr:hypothetical protein [Oceanospirillum sanctuarii]
MSNLDKFGKLIAEDLRDSALNRCLDIEAGTIKSYDCLELTKEFSQFTESQLQIINRLVTKCIDTGIHDFLFAIEEAQDELSILVNGENIAEKSDGLQGELFTEDGWYERFSEHKETGI